MFIAGLWWYLGGPTARAVANAKALEFLTGYLIEKALAVDNIFVFLMIFTYFAVPAEFQKRVLMIGILGALVLRAVMILVGAWLIAQFHWILYVFGAFLVFTGIKMWWAAGQEPDLEANPALNWLRRPPADRADLRRREVLHRGERRKMATPLFMVILLIGIVDVIFAVDSIPAIFAITTDPFIVLTSNVFAILGLRAMYFLLAGMHERFHLLTYGLAIVLVFIGAKMLLIDVYKIPVSLVARLHGRRAGADDAPVAEDPAEARRGRQRLPLRCQEAGGGAGAARLVATLAALLHDLGRLLVQRARLALRPRQRRRLRCRHVAAQQRPARCDAAGDLQLEALRVAVTHVLERLGDLVRRTPSPCSTCRRTPARTRTSRGSGNRRRP